MIATDGAGSAVRNAMLHGGVERFDFSQVWLEHGYKELHIPRETRRRCGFSASRRTPCTSGRGIKFMMIALPNFDGSFTCTLFLAHKSTLGRAVGKRGNAPLRSIRLTD